MNKEEPKKNFTVRLDRELRHKLELISEREYRTLTNQMMYFLRQGADDYLRLHHLDYTYDLDKGDYDLLPIVELPPDPNLF